MDFVVGLAVVVIVVIGGGVFAAVVGAFLLPLIAFFGGKPADLKERVNHKSHDYYDEYGG